MDSSSVVTGGAVGTTTINDNSGSQSNEFKVFLAPQNKTSCFYFDVELKVEDILSQLKREVKESPDAECDLFLSTKNPRTFTKLNRAVKLKDIRVNSEAYLIFKKQGGGTLEGDSDHVPQIVTSHPLGSLGGNIDLSPAPTNTTTTTTTTTTTATPSLSLLPTIMTSTNTNLTTTTTTLTTIPSPEIKQHNKQPSNIDTLNTEKFLEEELREKEQLKWLLCSICGNPIVFVDIENHARFCIDKGKTHGEDILQKETAVEEGFVIHLFQSIDEIFHLILCTVVAWILGYFGFSFFWTICLFFLIHRSNSHIKEKWHRIQNLKETPRKKKSNTLEVLNAEQCKWLNLLIEKFWPTISPNIDEALKGLLLRTLNNENVKPLSVKDFFITRLVFGNVAPEFKNMIGIRSPDPTLFKCTVDVLYAPRAEATISAEMFSLVKVPITFENIKIRGKMHITIEWIRGYPYIDHLQVGFIECPQIELSIQVANLVDIMDVSFLHDWLKNLIIDAVKANTVGENSLEFHLKSLLVPEKVNENSNANTPSLELDPMEDFTTKNVVENLSKRYFHPDYSQKTTSKYIHRIVQQKRDERMQLFKYFRDENKANRIIKLVKKEKKEELQRKEDNDLRKVMEHQKKKIQSGDAFNEIARLDVKILRSHGPQVENRGGGGGGAKLYLILRVGEQFYKTQYFPPSSEWNLKYSFKLKHEKKALEIQVNGYIPNSNNDFFMGKEEIYFTELKYEEKTEIWMSIFTLNTDYPDYRILIELFLKKD